MRSSEFAEMSFSSNTLPKDISPEALAAMKSFMQVVLIGSVSLGMIFAVGFAIFVLWFFMRKSVREQFEPENKENLAVN
jgi:flagellar biogenesis protein FliO